MSTLINHTDGKKSIRYHDDYILDSEGISDYIPYVQLTTEQIAEIEEATTDRVQEILSKLF